MYRFAIVFVLALSATAQANPLTLNYTAVQDEASSANDASEATGLTAEQRGTDTSDGTASGTDAWQSILAELLPQQAVDEQVNMVLKPGITSPDGSGTPALDGPELVKQTLDAFSFVSVSGTSGSSWNSLLIDGPSTETTPLNSSFLGSSLFVDVPEPSSFALAVLAALGCLGYQWFRRSRHAS